MIIWPAPVRRCSKIAAGTAMRSKRCGSLSCNIAAMVVAGSGAVGKRMLCSSDAARDERKLMAMRHAVCKYWGFLFLNKVTLVNLHGVPVLKRLWSCSRLSPDFAWRARPRQYWSVSSESRTMTSL